MTAGRVTPGPGSSVRTRTLPPLHPDTRDPLSEDTSSFQIFTGFTKCRLDTPKDLIPRRTFNTSQFVILRGSTPRRTNTLVSWNSQRRRFL